MCSDQLRSETDFMAVIAQSTHKQAESLRLAAAVESANDEASALVLQSLAEIGRRCSLKAWAARRHMRCRFPNSTQHLPTRASCLWADAETGRVKSQFSDQRDSPVQCFALHCARSTVEKMCGASRVCHLGRKFHNVLSWSRWRSRKMRACSPPRGSSVELHLFAASGMQGVHVRLFERASRGVELTSSDLLAA